MDGFEVARWIRAQSEHRHLYLLALTGYGQPGDRAAALEAGFDEHLVKPVDEDRLRRLMRGKEAVAGYAGSTPSALFSEDSGTRPGTI